MILQDVVGSALLDTFHGSQFAQRARDQDDWNVQSFPAQHFDGLHAIPIRELVIRQNHVVGVFPHQLGELLCCLGNISSGIQTCLPQRSQIQFDVGILIFD